MRMLRLRARLTAMRARVLPLALLAFSIISLSQVSEGHTIAPAAYTFGVENSWVRVQNVGFRLVGKRFRVFVHEPRTLERAATARGLERTRVSRGPIWETAQFDPARS